MSIAVTLNSDGHKTAVLQVCAYDLGKALSMEEVLALGEMEKVPARLRLDAITYALQGKLGVHLWWKGREGSTYLLPLEGRGKLNLEEMGGMQSPVGATALCLSTYNLAPNSNHFLLLLDFSK